MSEHKSATQIEKVYTVEDGDWECGVGLHSIHATMLGAEGTALELIKGKPNGNYKEVTTYPFPEPEIVRLWQTHEMGDIVMVREKKLYD